MDAVMAGIMSGIQWNFRIMDMLGTQPFVLCREVVLFQSVYFVWSVYKRTFRLSFVGRLSSYGVSFIGGFTVLV